jgi:hypothetical protein
MSQTDPPVFFESTISFDPERIGAVAVYCSDGRFGEQFDDLLHTALGFPRYDRLAIPGGAACLANHFSAYREEHGVRELLRFLVEVHDLRHVVLVAHEGCAFYGERLRVSPLQLESQQREDMRKAVARVHAIGGHLDVQAFFARRHHRGTVRFERWD